MRYKLLKFVLVIGFTLALFFCFSFSAFASDVNFVLGSVPIQSATNTSEHQISSAFIKTEDSSYYYVEFVCDRNTGSRPYYFESNSFFNICSRFDSRDNTDFYNIDGCLYVSDTYGGYSKTFPLNIYVYDITGTLVQHYFSYIGGNAAVGLYVDNGLYGKSTRVVSGDYSFLKLFDEYSYIPYLYSSTYTSLNTYYFNNSSTYPSVISVADSSNSLLNANGSVYSSIDDNIYLNGSLVYGSGGGSNLASKIIGSIGGTISLPDGNGGTTTGDINVDVDLDLPEYDGDIGTDEFPTMPQFDDSALSVIDGGSALQWVYARVNDLVTTNQKVFALVTSCLSLGVIMLILNKRS